MISVWINTRINSLASQIELTMQTIYLTPATINFTQIPNRLIASQIPLAAKAILNYLLSKPKDWLMRRTDLKRTLGLTGYAIQKGLSWLQSNGYAFLLALTDIRHGNSTMPHKQQKPLQAPPLLNVSKINMLKINTYYK